MQVVEIVNENGAAKPQRVSVKRGAPTLVPPAEPTPTGEQYYLSNLDQNIAVIVKTVYCYNNAGGGDPAAALRDALARVLVHYHPLAGRLGISPEMKLTVELTAEGAVFVEADAACDLADVGDLTKPDPAALGQLVYSVPGAKNVLEMPPMTAQVSSYFRTLLVILILLDLIKDRFSMDSRSTSSCTLIRQLCFIRTEVDGQPAPKINFFFLVILPI
jgi:hypothetical protein